MLTEKTWRVGREEAGTSVGTRAAFGMPSQASGGLGPALPQQGL